MIDEPSAFAPGLVMSQLQYLRADLRARGVVRMRTSTSANSKLQPFCVVRSNSVFKQQSDIIALKIRFENNF